MKPLLRTLGRALTGLAAAAAFQMPALAQELRLYYPVAVGGPITKIVDTLAADFEKELPGI